MSQRCIAAEGRWGTVEWAEDVRQRQPARKYYQGLDAKEKAKALALFQRLAETGQIRDRTKFKNLGDRAGGEGAELFEFKSGQVRFLGDFRSGGRFLVAHGLRKKRSNLNPADLRIAVRILRENDERERSGR